jgi:hypothetical protein
MLGQIRPNGLLAYDSTDCKDARDAALLRDAVLTRHALPSRAHAPCNRFETKHARGLTMDWGYQEGNERAEGKQRRSAAAVVLEAGKAH